MIIPPFAGVALLEYRDRIELTPYYWTREFVGLGKMKASEVGPAPGDEMRPFFDAMMGDGEIWVIARWRRYEDGTEEPMNLHYLDSHATEEEARKELDSLADFANETKQQLQDLAACFEASEEDLAYIEERFPDIKHGPPDPSATDEFRVYQARLRVLAGFQPKTVTLAPCFSINDLKGRVITLQGRRRMGLVFELSRWWFFAADSRPGAGGAERDVG